MKNLDTNKHLKKYFLLTKNLSTPSTITSHNSIGIAKLSLITIKNKSSKTFLYIFQLD